MRPEDFRYAATALRRSPVFAAAVIVTLTIGLGLNVTAFAIVNAVLLKDLPFAKAERIVSIRFGGETHRSPEATVPSPLIGAWESSRLLEVIAPYTIGEMSVLLPTGEPIRISSAFVSAGLFSMVEATPSVGRLFRPDDTIRGGARVVIVSHRFWRDHMSSSPTLDSVMLNRTRYAVVGVLHRDFQFPDLPAPDLFMPLRLPQGDVVASVRLIALAHEVDATDHIEAELRALGRSALDALPKTVASRVEQGGVPIVVPLREHLEGDQRNILLIAFAVAVAVLLIACANVACLMMARASARSQEMAIRVALGSSARRLASLVIAESAILALAGGGLAVLTTLWLLPAAQAFYAGPVPHQHPFLFDRHVLAFAVLACLVSALLCAILPLTAALGAFRQGPSALRPTISSGTWATSVTRRGLVVAQVGGATMLLVVALLLLGTLRQLAAVELGFAADNLLTLRIPAYTSAWREPRAMTLEAVLARLRSAPHVTAAAATTSLPLDGHSFRFSVPIAGRPAPAENHSTSVAAVSAGYFGATRARVLSGREFDSADTAQSLQVAVVNRAFINSRGLSVAEGVGRRLGLGGTPEGAGIEIVGVVQDLKDGHPGTPTEPVVFRPFSQAAPNLGWHTANVILRTETDPLLAMQAVRRILGKELPGATVYDVRPMDQRLRALVAPQRERAQVFALFGATALLLAGLGLYGLLTFVVTREMREFGIRIAIGASPAAVGFLVLRRGLAVTIIGVTCGLAGAWVLARFLSGLLFGVTVNEPGIYAGAGVIMLLVAALSSGAPALTAMRADPVTTLRAE